MFNVHLFQSKLSTRNLGRNLIYKRETTSTMDDGLKLLMDNINDGSIVLAEMQTNGRGRQNREWESIELKNIYMSILYTFHSFQDALKMNFAPSIALVQVCHSLGIHDAMVKWPNDVWIGHKKLSGLLVDVSSMGNNFYLNCGMGVCFVFVFTLIYSFILLD